MFRTSIAAVLVLFAAAQASASPTSVSQHVLKVTSSFPAKFHFEGTQTITLLVSRSFESKEVLSITALYVDGRGSHSVKLDHYLYSSTDACGFPTLAAASSDGLHVIELTDYARKPALSPCRRTAASGIEMTLSRSIDPDWWAWIQARE